MPVADAAGGAETRVDLTASALVRTSGLVVLTLATSAGLALGVQLLLARWLGAAEFGRYLYALTWVNTLAALCVLGYDAAALRFVAAYRATADRAALGQFQRAGTRALLVGAMVGALGLAAVLGLGVQRADPSLALLGWVALPLLPLLAAGKFLAAVLQALSRVVLSQVLVGIVRPVALVGLLGLALAGGLGGAGATAMAANVGSAAIVVAAASWWTGRLVGAKGSHPVPEARRSEWRRATRAQLGIVAAQLGLLYGDTLAVGLLMSTLDAGVYAVSAQFASLVAFTLPALNAVAAPGMAGLHAAGRMDDLRRLIVRVARAATASALVAAVAVGGLGGVVLGVFGPEFRHGQPAVLVLAAAQLVAALHAPAGFALTMTGRETDASRIIGGAALGHLLLVVLLVPALGLVGAALATLAATVARNLLLGRQVRRELGLSIVGSVFASTLRSKAT